MSSESKIIKNTFFLSTAYIAQKLISFVYFTLIARIADVGDTGAYVFALSYSTIFSVFVDFGLALYIQREIAQVPEKTRYYINNALGIKTFYALGAVVVGLIVIRFLTDDPLTLTMVGLAMILTVFDSIHLTLWAAFRGHYKLKYESVGVVVGQLIVLIFGIGGLLAGASLVILIGALIFGSLFNVVYSLILTKAKLGFWPKPDLRISNKKISVKKSLPFGLASAFTRVFSSFDSVFLRLMVSDIAVGLYSVPNKIVFAIQFIPAAFAASIYPAMSHLYKSDQKKMIWVFEKSLLFLLMISIPITVGIFILTPRIIGQIFTEKYLDSIPAMYILVWAIVLGFFEYPLGSLLSAIGEQVRNMKNRGLVMLLNIVCNIILIPKFSFVGASIAAIISYLLLLLLGVYYVNKFIQIQWKGICINGFKIALAGLFMGVVVKLILPYLHMIFLILIGAIVYLISILIFNIVKTEEIKSIVKTLKGK